MTPDALPGFVAIGSLVFGAAASVAALRLRARSQADRFALRAALAREAAFVESARRLSDAARESIEAVRDEIDRAVRAIAPTVDVVLFFEEHEGELVCIAARGPRVDFFAGMRLALDDETSLIVHALRCGHRLTAAEAPQTRLLHPGDAFAAAIPLVLDAGRRCALYVGALQPSPDAIADRIVQLVDQATPAYRIALERAEDRARAEYDGLTGLLSARAFRGRLTDLVERARYAERDRVSLLFIDTDRFKAWNDTYGHASGDALLRELARLLRAAAFADADLVGRNGGDEFCVVLAETEKSHAIERAERLRESIAAADFGTLRGPSPVGTEVRISASIGVACYPADAGSPSDLLEKADLAMYHSKKTGRDGVSFFGIDGALVRAGTAISEHLQ